MKVKDIVDFSFILCSLGDSVNTVVTKMESKKKSYCIVTDTDNRYKGIITAISLIKYTDNKDCIIDSLVYKLDAISENDDIKNLKKVAFDIVPVVNLKNNVVGVISMKSFVQYMHDGTSKLQKNQLITCKDHIRLRSKYTIDDIIGQSKVVLQLKAQITAAAKTKSTVLITGDTGTGKELVAQAIANLSNRKNQPFMRINCAAIAENLLESELFGYEEGAFTGAIKGGRAGKFLMADGGTIFLDEIGDMQFSLQAKILRVLQEREIEKIGGQFPIPINVRIIAATHADLERMVNEKKFRHDLFYRLHVISIIVPPLNKRKEDIPLLVDHYIRKFSKENDMEDFKIHHSFIKCLVDYDWPGNIRELLNVLETVCSMSNGFITHEDIPQYMYHKSSCNIKGEESINNLKILTSDAQRNMIINTLIQCRGNKDKVAKVLGISRSNLYYKIKKLNINNL
ncbi:sigma 54-interacting transcriptional regulator [Clostridium algoriphilum]|uniref:sigma 54-interacting transcriptional regulator n=1 Tax=Clostridium algoriphilum TaxID=198347 RepID=UPI001CF3B2D7|nr:sigma 54-interacting transcriptional regulator [Clostridium algoriphilum]MCB2294794.1 sigma 54-interacting transcriptional regulator [Clostridium algoriphilum]